MPTALFQKELNDVMYSKFNKGVYGTGKKIVDRMMKYYKKELVDNHT
jgi:hypothetical protein